MTSLEHMHPEAVDALDEAGVHASGPVAGTEGRQGHGGELHMDGWIILVQESNRIIGWLKFVVTIRLGLQIPNFSYGTPVAELFPAVTA